jgi:hypothetical protein
MSPLDSLTSEAKLIQVISIAIKHANKSFLSQLGRFSLHFSLGVEGWLWIRWVLRFGGFDCFLLLVVGGAGNNLGALFSLLSSHLSKPTPNLYVDLVTLSSTQLKSSSIFSLNLVFSTQAVK